MTQTPLITGTNKIKVIFKCSANDSAPIAVSGDVAELGNWNIGAALMTASHPRPQGGFEWTAQVELPLGHTIEYKFIKIGENGARWESGNNRRITIIPGLHTLNADFRE